MYYVYLMYTGKETAEFMRCKSRQQTFRSICCSFGIVKSFIFLPSRLPLSQTFLNTLHCCLIREKVDILQAVSWWWRAKTGINFVIGQETTSASQTVGVETVAPLCLC